MREANIPKREPRTLQIGPAQALYVGNDPLRDVPGPQAIGMPVILIHREGPRPPTEVPVINNLKEIQKVIYSHFG